LCNGINLRTLNAIVVRDELHIVSASLGSEPGFSWFTANDAIKYPFLTFDFIPAKAAVIWLFLSLNFDVEFFVAAPVVKADFWALPNTGLMPFT
jgi:hypothetical protein